LTDRPEAFTGGKKKKKKKKKQKKKKTKKNKGKSQDGPKKRGEGTIREKRHPLGLERP